MNIRNTIKWLAALLVVIGLTAVGFVIGRLTGDTTRGSDVEVTETDNREILYWRAPMDPTEIYDSPGKSKMGMDLVPVYAGEEGAQVVPTSEREILYWRAPMDPTEIYDSPGKSRMGMDLIPVYEGETATGSRGIVTIDPSVVQNMGVTTEEVRRVDFSRTIRTVGEVKYDEERLYIVNSKVAGWIDRLYVNYVGDEVNRGDRLMEIYSPELVSTQEEYLLAVKNYEKAAESGIPSVEADAARLLASTRKRLEYWDIPEEEIERLKTTGQIAKTILLRAPATGIVIKRNAIDGAYIKAGMDLFEIADLRSVWVHASFYDNEVPWIREGQRVEMELSYLPGRTYSGRVSYVYPYLREEARDVHVRLEFENPDRQLKPGMYANVQLQGKVIPDAIVVPTEAVIRSGTRNIMFVARGQGRFEPREVRLGEEGGPENCCVRIISGVLEGEEVVTSAQFMLDSESRLQEAIQKMLDERARRDAGAWEGAGQLPTAADPAAPSRVQAPARQADTTAMDHSEHDMEPSAETSNQPAETPGMQPDQNASTQTPVEEGAHEGHVVPAQVDTTHDMHEHDMRAQGDTVGRQR